MVSAEAVDRLMPAQQPAWQLHELETGSVNNGARFIKAGHGTFDNDVEAIQMLGEAGHYNDQLGAMFGQVRWLLAASVAVNSSLPL